MIWKKKLSVYLLSITVFLLFSVRADAKNNKMVNFTRIKKNVYSSSVRVGTQQSVYHKITVKSDGILRFSGYSRKGKSKKRFGIYGQLIKADKRLKNRQYYVREADRDQEQYLNTSTYDDAYYAIKKGTYYFLVNTVGMAGYS